jgi:hypothetical protein
MFFTNEWQERTAHMALYIVRARPKGKEGLAALRREMDSGEIASLEPFGEALQHGLENAKIDRNSDYAIWVEEDYCSPPLAMERTSVLDRYFERYQRRAGRVRRGRVEQNRRRQFIVGDDDNNNIEDKSSVIAIKELTITRVFVYTTHWKRTEEMSVPAALVAHRFPLT